MTKKYIDWHTHTLYSDGRDDPNTVVRNAKVLGIESLAITDHDSMGGYREAKDLAQKWKIDLVPGVEVSTKKYHILGLNVDPANLEFASFLQRVRSLKWQEWGEKVEMLNQKGIPITMTKVRNYFDRPEQRIGKINVYVTMMMDDACNEVLSSMGYGMNARDVGRFFADDGVLGKVEDKYFVTSKEAIAQIHAAGGISVVAHPFKQAKSGPSELDELVNEGIDGLEVQPNYTAQNTPFVEYAKERQLLITYGSDFHGSSLVKRPLLGRGENQVDVEKLLRGSAQCLS